MPGIGEKTALALISKFGSLQGVYDYIDDKAGAAGDARDIEKQIKELTKLMKEAAQNLEFEQAVIYRDKIKALELLAMRTYDNSIFVNGG